MNSCSYNWQSGITQEICAVRFLHWPAEGTDTLVQSFWHQASTYFSQHIETQSRKFAGYCVQF